MRCERTRGYIPVSYYIMRTDVRNKFLQFKQSHSYGALHSDWWKVGNGRRGGEAADDVIRDVV